MTSMYDWRDPWATIDKLEHVERHWRDREDEHRSQMRGMALAFADSSHELQRRYEAVLAPVLRIKALENNVPSILMTQEEFDRKFGK